MDKFKIDDAAKETGLTKRTIRYYEELGLIKEPERTDGGTRMYSREDIERLKKVVLAKDILGFSLQELQDFVKLREKIQHHREDYQNSSDMAKRKGELDFISQGLAEQIEMIDAKMDRMRDFRDELSQLQDKVTQLLKE
ncbi:MerR family transcriptional regulator [Bacillus sp. FJAT-42376]|uniref:MerR family transcriptional regulator n=1 Tax=Bacillus sp. FJAT-42376 TaxID=2014076 RepID=UPI000F50222B|nr:MerR family transcriptional regulator [Bacillus sp. FJAT-42376]AZB44951.1 MerR family transcriptional regulator [Bacillus sp. FJAT-42376]